MKKDVLHEQRVLIIEAIYQFYVLDKTPKEIVNKIFLQNSKISKNNLDKLLNCLDNAVSIEYIIDNYLVENWSFWRLANMDKAILIWSIYELIASDTDAKIIIDEAIILAKEYGTDHSYKLINGVLDKIYKNLSDVKKQYHGKNI